MAKVKTYGDVVTRQQLREKIRLASILGFQDDVEYWKAELKKLEDG